MGHVNDENQLDLTNTLKTDHTIFVLTIIDEGIRKRTIIHRKLDGIASLSKTAIQNILTKMVRI
jgi:hypothetical protein